MRDGVHLHANVYVPRRHEAPGLTICTLTPYTAHVCHEQAMYFAARGIPAVVVEVRGRGNSEGEFWPILHDALDGFDVVEWAATQPYCNGQVAMWGGSYAACAQWLTATELPPHLVTIVPVAAVFFGVDFPIRANMFASYLMQWLTLVSGRTSQEKLFYGNERFWAASFREWFESGAPFKALDTVVGNPSKIFQEWTSHPSAGEYWDRYNPTPADYARLRLPILTITGIYDNAQSGSLAHYRNHLGHVSEQTRSQHFLVIGPWDHAGTRDPQTTIAGVRFGDASLLDVRALQLQWFAWVTQRAGKPEFLRKNVAYYVCGTDEWRYADTLEEVTARTQPFYLDSAGAASFVFASGRLTAGPGEDRADAYIYDPRDVSIAELESASPPTLCLRPAFPMDNLTDQARVHREGEQLIYHSEPFLSDAEVSGFFRLRVWIGIDQPDTDLQVAVFEIDPQGQSILLTADAKRARYRDSARVEQLIRTKDPLEYEFSGFTFVSRLIQKGSRLRLVVGPVNSIFSEKNYNSGGRVVDESMKEARVVTVTLYHGVSYPSALYVPFGDSNQPHRTALPLRAAHQ